MKIILRVAGKPVPKGRPRFSKYGRVFTPQTTEEYENLIADAWRAQHPDIVFTGDVEIWSYFGTKRHRSTDLDNLEKSVWDGLEKGGAFIKGDSQVYASHASKYPPVGDEGIIVVIKELDSYTFHV
jgi:crossover junction endodeoxyribonuclease RusA